jgi:RNA polymerase sigma-70 factor (ECF subfamily)
MSADLDFESLVSSYYQPLYRFAVSLTRSEADACDLTQQTFYLWATKGHQLRDSAKVKSWLFTTLHREFLEKTRKQTRFPHHELSQMSDELPNIAPELASPLDAATVLSSLAQLEDLFQAPIALFYLEDYSYKEIAEVLEIPLGTVKSRIFRGLAQLQQIMTDGIRPAGALKIEHHG